VLKLAGLLARATGLDEHDDVCPPGNAGARSCRFAQEPFEGCNDDDEDEDEMMVMMTTMMMMHEYLVAINSRKK
jgi:hypothetical protein